MIKSMLLLNSLQLLKYVDVVLNKKPIGHI